MTPINRIFYTIKPVIPRQLQIFIRRQIVQHQRMKNAATWPIDEGAGNPPAGWRGWPENKQFALVLMHDVDTQAGHDKCRRLMDLEEALGFRSSFNFVAERYRISKDLLNEIKARGFEIGVHGLKHDGKLFSSRSVFLERAKKINDYLAEWGVQGFSSPSMHHNLQWMHDLNIKYATSTFDTDPFEPQPEGVRTIFPFSVNGASGDKRYLEIPYTMPQDFTLFILMKQQDTDIWLKKLAWIAEKGGMVLFNSHPDYMNFNGCRRQLEEYPASLYAGFLQTVKETYQGRYWHALPGAVADYCLETTTAIQSN